MDDVTVVLQVLVEVYLDMVAIAAQVVARQVHQHHMFGILLRVVTQVFCSLAVGFFIACTSGGSCNRVDIGLAACSRRSVDYPLPFNAAMGLG